MVLRDFKSNSNVPPDYCDIKFGKAHKILPDRVFILSPMGSGHISPILSAATILHISSLPMQQTTTSVTLDHCTPLALSLTAARLLDLPQKRPHFSESTIEIKFLSTLAFYSHLIFSSNSFWTFNLSPTHRNHSTKIRNNASIIIITYFHPD